MTPEILITVIGVALAIMAIITFLIKKPKKHLDKTAFRAKWRKLQKHLGRKETWSLAIIEADSLLDMALKKRRYKGKTMGERLVAAQRDLTNNDGVWYSHKLRNQLVHEPDIQLKEKDVKRALLGFGQALKDLEAL